MRPERKPRKLPKGVMLPAKGWSPGSLFTQLFRNTTLCEARKGLPAQCGPDLVRMYCCLVFCPDSSPWFRDAHCIVSDCVLGSHSILMIIMSSLEMRHRGEGTCPEPGMGLFCSLASTAL